MNRRPAAPIRATTVALAVAAGLSMLAAALGLGPIRIELGLAALLVAARTVMLRPRPGADGHRPGEHSRALEIVESNGTDSLAPFALREDKALHFAAGGFLAYRVLRETAVVSGDPIGPPGSAGSILRSFLRVAERRRWRVVLTAASDRHLGEYRELGLSAMRIGEEAVVDPRSFSLEGRKIRKVRQSVARVERRGWTVEVVQGRDLTDDGLAFELAEVEESWRSRQKRLTGFAMTLGRLAGAGEDPAGVYVLGRDPEGELRAFLRFATLRDGLSLDLMRRSGGEPNGLNEALVVAAIEHARSAGLAQISLNFAGFAHVMASDAALSHGQRLLRLTLRAVHGRFQLERLVRFNAKFEPEWRPRHLVYGSLAQLPLAALRVLQAEAYVSGPRSPSMPERWKSAPLARGLPAPAETAAVPYRPRPALAWVGATALLVLSLVLPGQFLGSHVPTAATAKDVSGLSQAVPAGALQSGPSPVVDQEEPVMQTLDARADRLSVTRRPAIARPTARERRLE
ncbi:MAG TPA: DUF2156 domain-containing protein [Solirubrobacterales bacterium]|nr:DUF2156 domain-containing protein [Solirubrobacterales bacterium]